MKFTNSIKKIIVPALLLFSFVECAAAEYSPDEADVAQMAEQLQDMREHILKEVVNQLSSINVCLEDLQLDIINNVIKDIDSRAKKDKIITQIKKIRQLLTALENNGFAQIDEYTLLFLLNFNQQVIEHLTSAVEKGFSELPDFTPEQMRSVPTDEDFDYAKLQMAVKETNEKLDRFAQLAKSAGLTWYNKLYRSFDNYVVQPASKYKVPQIAGVAALTGAAAFTIAFHSSWENKTFRKIFGYPPKIVGGSLDDTWHEGFNNAAHASNYQKTLDKINNDKDADLTKLLSKIDSLKPREARDMKWLGETEYFYYKYIGGYMPLISLVAPIVGIAYKEALMGAKDYVQKKVNKTINFLKGGEYRNRPDGISELKSSITFNDLVGLEHAKDVARTVLKYIEDPERFARKNLVPERGYILYGKSRTGKSEFARAFCGEIQNLMKQMGRSTDDYSFYEIKTSVILKEGIEYILALAKEAAPCVLFIDEIDLLGLQRAGGDRAVLSGLLSTMSGFVESDPKKQVIILAASNKPENIDFALRQRGRFGKALYFDYPTLDNRLEFLRKRLSGLSVDVDIFDVEKLARETDGCTYEDLNAMIKCAFQKAKILGITLSQEHLELSLDEEIRNIVIRDEKDLPLHEQTILATHQVGKALGYMWLNDQEIVSKVTILPIVNKLKEENAWDSLTKDDKNPLYKPIQNVINGPQRPIEYGKVFVYRDHDSLKLATKDDLLVQCKIMIAGLAAQKALLGTSSSSYHPEERHLAYEIAKSVVFDGIDPQQLSKDTKNALLEDAFKMVQTCESEMLNMFEKNKPILQKLVNALVKHKMLSKDELDDLIANTSLARPLTISTQPIAADLTEVRA